VLDIRRRTGITFGLIMVAQVILVSAQVTTKAGPKLLSLVIFEAFSRVQRVTGTVVHGSRNAWGNYVALRGVRAENAALHRQVEDLQVRLQQEHAAAARTQALEQMLALKVQATVPTISAQVIAGNPNPGMRTITIDRGSADGIVADMAVIAPAGIVGRVIGPTARHAARVQLIVDRNAAAGAIGERSRAGGMVIGTDGDPPLRMDLVSNLSELKAGENVVTSGVDGIYPRGYLIGWVQRTERGAGLYRNVTVRPAVDFSSLEEVLVVLVPPRPATRDEAEK
jgi:rod shape-determining protein MreC